MTGGVPPPAGPGPVISWRERCDRAAALLDRRDPILRRLCATVLVFEAVIIGLAIPVAITIGHLNGGVAGGVGGSLAAVAVLLAGLLGRSRWGLFAGTAFQVFVVAAGIAVPVMYALGLIFAGFWVAAIWLTRTLRDMQPD